MDGTRKSRMRSRIGWIAASAMLVIAPTASADHDRDDDDRWTNQYDYYGWGGEYGYGDPRWDPGRHYDRFGYWPASGPYPEFHDLHGFGRWHSVPGFGGPVWFPYVAATWRPYFYGHWIHSRFGMTWVSYEPWGDLTHHYGHWVFVDHYGWGWVPGWEWGPAWVTWGVADGYIGWAPLPPPGYVYPSHCRYTPGHHHPDYRWSVSFAYDSSGLDFGLWVFVSDRDFHGASIHSHAVPVRHTLSFFKEKRVLPVGRDLHVDYVKRVSSSPVRTVELTQRTKTTDGRTLVFREPRGQEAKIREGREATRKLVATTPANDRARPDRVEKTRSGEVVGKPPVSPEPRREESSGKSGEIQGSRGELPTKAPVVTESSEEPSRAKGRVSSDRETPSRGKPAEEAKSKDAKETSGRKVEKRKR